VLVGVGKRVRIVCRGGERGLGGGVRKEEERVWRNLGVKLNSAISNYFIQNAFVCLFLSFPSLFFCTWSHLRFMVFFLFFLFLMRWKK
jgi:hypothetical protein